MADCAVPAGAVALGADSEKGYGTIDGAEDSLVSTEADEQAAAVDELKTNIDVDAMSDAIAKALDGTGYAGEDASAKDNAALDKIADALLGDIVKDARDGLKARRERAKKLIDQVTGSTVGAAGWWMNLKAKAYTAWASARGDMNLWLGVLGKQEGRDTYDNTMVQAFETLPSKIRTEEEKYRTRLRQLLRDFQPYAEAAGIPLEKFAVAVGKYATCLHAEEANSHIVDTYNRLIQELEAEFNALPPEKQTDGRGKKIDQLRDMYKGRIAIHQQYVNERYENIPKAARRQLYIAGYTNADAKIHMEALRDRLKIDEATAMMLSHKIRDEFNFILKERARLGTLDPNEAAKFPNFQHYVPMMSSSHTEGFGNLSGNMHDATPYNPGEYHAMMGNSGVEPDSAFVSLGYYARRASMEVASKDFGTMLDALYRRLESDKAAGKIKDHGLRAYDYDDLMKKMMTGDNITRQLFNDIYNRGGMVATIPTADGKLKKTFFTFTRDKFEVNGGRFDGARLNRALSSDFHMAEPGPLALLRPLTSLSGQMVTRFSPMFAPLAGTRDFSERGLNIVSRTYYKEDGTPVSGASLFPAFIRNAVRGGDIFLKGKLGKLDPGSKEAKIYQEFIDEGCGQAFAQRFYAKDASIADLTKEDSPGRTFASMIGVSAPGAQKALHLIGNVSTGALRTLDNWNDYFQNASAFAHFLTLREAGVSAQEAGVGVLREMNLSQKGELAPTLQCVAPFVVPTVQSAVAMARTLGFGADRLGDIPKKGWKGLATAVTAFTAYSLLLPLVQDALGYDEAGASRFDALSLDQASKAIPIGYGDNGDYVKFPIGYGLPNVAALLAVGGDRVRRGLMSPLDLMFETLYTTVQNMSPGNWPEYGPMENPARFVVSMITPAPFLPIAEVGMNTTRYGREIAREPMDETQSKADLGRVSTPGHDHRAAKYIRDTLGVDMQPEMYRHLENRYLSGPLAMLRLLADDMDETWKGKDLPDSLHSLPFPLNAIGMSYFYGHQNSAAKTMFFNAERLMNEEIRAEGIRLTQPAGHKMPADEYRRQVLLAAGKSPEWVEDYIAIYNAKKKQRENAKKFTEDYKPRWLEGDSSEDLRTALQQYEAGDEDIYSATVQALHFYRNSGALR